MIYFTLGILNAAFWATDFQKDIDELERARRRANKTGLEAKDWEESLKEMERQNGVVVQESD